MRTSHLLVGILLAAVIGSGALRAQSTDEALARRVCDALHKNVHLTIFDDVTVSARGRLVTLDGRVTSPAKLKAAERSARQTPGVGEVTNHVRVLPESRDDVELRRQIAGAIYGHPAFWPYASMARPPIHILVEHRQVRLTGMVASEAERRLAFALAQVRGAASVKNHLRLQGR